MSVDIYSGLLLSHKKKQIWVCPIEVDEPGVCYTQWSKSEREKQESYINTYIWKLEKWYWWTCLQVSNRDADIENRLVDTVGEGEGGTNQESNIETYTLPHILEMDGQWEFAV